MKMETSRFKYRVKRAFPFRLKGDLFPGGDSALSDLFKKAPGGRTVRPDTQLVFSRAVYEGCAVYGLNPSGFQSDDGFFIVGDGQKSPCRRKMRIVPRKSVKRHKGDHEHDKPFHEEYIA